jgi:hypothetical protein
MDNQGKRQNQNYIFIEKRFLRQMVKHDWMDNKRKENILKELEQNLYYRKFQNIKLIGFNMLSECKERDSPTTKKLQTTGTKELRMTYEKTSHNSKDIWESIIRPLR